MKIIPLQLKLIMCLTDHLEFAELLCGKLIMNTAVLMLLLANRSDCEMSFPVH